MARLPAFRTFRHCPRCGHHLVWRQPRGQRRRQTCPQCGYRVYHNPVAAVEAYFLRAGKVLLLRRNEEPRAGFWDIPGGFLEVGEEPLEGLHREIHEELNARLVRPKLFGAYRTGYWVQNELTSIVVLAYAAELRGHITLNHENSELEWVPLSRARRLAFFHQQRALRDLARLARP